MYTVCTASYGTRWGSGYTYTSTCQCIDLRRRRRWNQWQLAVPTCLMNGWSWWTVYQSSRRCFRQSTLTIASLQCTLIQWRWRCVNIWIWTRSSAQWLVCRWWQIEGWRRRIRWWRQWSRPLPSWRWFAWKWIHFDFLFSLSIDESCCTHWVMDSLLWKGAFK